MRGGAARDGEALSRRGPTVLVVALLVATAAAFVFTQRRKLEPSTIAAVRVDKLFSPVCRCSERAATLEFRLRRPDVVTVEIVDTGGARVRTLVRRRSVGTRALRLAWDGRDEAGDVVESGTYRPRLRLEREGRTFLPPSPITVDTIPPKATIVRMTHRAPATRVRVFYRLSEPAQPLLYVNGRRVVRGATRRAGKLEWFGRIAGRRVPPGTYRIELAARDTAGNLGPREVAGVIRIA